MNTRTEDQNYTVMLSERLQDIMRDPRWNESEREHLLKINLDVVNGKPMGEALSDAELRKATLAQLLNMEAREAATQMYQEKVNPLEPLKLLKDSDLMERPDPEWWIDGILPKNTIVEIASAPGLGKTFFAMHLSRAMASGMKCFGRDVSVGKTLYVVAEGAAAFGKRARAWNETHPYYLVPDGHVQYLESGVNLSLDKSVDELREVFRDGDFDLLVIDTWSQLSGMEDENRSTETAAIINALRKIREVKPGASVLIVHHTDARGLKARGSTAHLANVDALWMLKRDTGGGFSMSSYADDGGKMKDAKPEKINGFKLVDAFGSAVIEWTGKTADSVYWTPIRDFLADNLEHTGGDIRQACGITESKGAEYDAWKSYMALLTRSEVLVKTGSSTRPVYRLAAPIPGAVL